MSATLLFYEMERRQDGPRSTVLPNGNGYGTDDDDGGTNIPTYVWIVVVVFLAFALTCGVCARRNYRRQYLYRQDPLSNRPPPILPFSRIGRPAIFDPNGVGGGILRPPRARRRPSQASVTSLPVYMENPGDREVVLLQRTGPKEDERHSSSSPTSQLGSHPQPTTVPVGTYQPPSAPLPPTNPTSTVNPTTAPSASTEARPSEPATHDRPLEPPGLERAASAGVSTVPANADSQPTSSREEDRRSPPPAWSSTNPFTQPGTR